MTKTAIKTICAMLLTAFLCACAEAAPTVEYNGRELTKEEIEAIGAAIESEEQAAMQTEKETAAQTEEETREPADGVLFWTDGGKVWHESALCSYLSNKDNVHQGNEEQAREAKKERGCAFCCP